MIRRNLIVLALSFVGISASLLPLPIIGADNDVYFTDQNSWWNESPADDARMKITPKDVNRSLAFGSGVLGRMHRLETNLHWSKIEIKQGTAAHAQLIEANPEKEAMAQGKEALIAAKATIHLMNSHCYRHHLNPSVCAKQITKYNLHGTEMGPICSRFKTPCDSKLISSKYRTIDGYCTRKNKPTDGQTFSSYRRLLFPDYLDGVHEPRRSQHKKQPLASPRQISAKLVKHEGVEEEYTLALMQWGQFMGHDLAHTAASKMVHSDNAIECCTLTGLKLSPRYVHPFCAPIHIPTSDRFYSQHGLQCMTYVRSIPALRPDCTFGPLEQMNQASHYMDGSQMYGSEDKRAKSLRTFSGGKLLTTKQGGQEYLPLSTDPGHDCQITFKEVNCFISGDSRVNLIPQLTAMHTIWVREHNRIAEILAGIKRDWDDETLYQETRRIVIAQMQHITYEQWLPNILGKKYVAKILSTPFMENLEGSVSNSFATAAIRFIKSMVAGDLNLYDEDRKVTETISLKEHFNAPNVVMKPGRLDSLLRGLTVQKSKKADLDYVKDVANLMYGNGQKGFDIISLDIQRGRDHGLPSYLAFRELCGLPKIQSFEGLKDIMPSKTVKVLSEAYKHPADIDLLIGGLSEQSLDNGLLGPTFSCILADQFLHTRSADRYFYTNQAQPVPFTDAQLAEIKKISLARIFCNNGDEIKRMQVDVFHHISESNPLVSCDDPRIPNVDLSKWVV